jgi:beta-fructofuranosidase
MFTRVGHHLGDSWYRVEADRVHMYYLTCADTVERHTRWGIGHASSYNLVTWDRHSDVLESDAEDSQRSCLATGSVIRWAGRYLMAVIGNHNSPEPRTLFLESENLDNWRVLEGVGFGIDGNVYTRRGSLPFRNPRWRDPFLYVEDGWLYCLMTAAAETAPVEADGVVGVLRTRNLDDWEVRPPLRLPRLGTDLECPKLYRFDGSYHLLVSMFNVLQAPAFAALQPPDENTSTTFSLVADSLQGPYRFRGNARVLQRDVTGFPYACEAVRWKDQWYLLGTCWSDRKGDSICDPVPIKATSIGFRSAG